MSNIKITAEEAAKIGGYSNHVFNILLDSGAIPFTEKDNQRLVSVGDFNNFIANNKRLQEKMSKEAQVFVK